MEKYISLKYCMENGNWFSNTPRGRYGVGLWKEIRKAAVQLMQNCSLEVGDGHKVGFCEGAWCRETPLCSSFPLLYEVVDSKAAKVEKL